MSPPASLIVFTDLDGTLLDETTYSFESARPAIDELKGKGAAIIPCTSKTGAETRHFMGLLGIEFPYIVESGGGIHIPEGCLPGGMAIGEECDFGRLLRLSAGYAEVLEGMAEMKEAAGGGIVGFHDLSAEVIAEETGLPIHLARLAKEREFDEPFRILGDDSEWPRKSEASISRRGLRITRGGRYWHLHGETDKGRAVEVVKSFYLSTGSPILTVGVGDSTMDLPLLQSVDIPVVIPRRGKAHDQSLVRGLRSPLLAEAPGPEGWGPATLQATARLLGDRPGFRV